MTVNDPTDDKANARLREPIPFRPIPQRFPVERRPTQTGRLGLSYATLPRLPHPGTQYVVAPALDNGEMDMLNGYQDAFRDPAHADAVLVQMEAEHPDFEWHVWSREIGWFRLDD